MGRRKIEIKMVKDTNTRQVTFSKRRTGLFKKANELSILCGAEVAIVVFSPGNKPYSFGHPGVDAVAAKYLTPQGDQEQQDPPTDGEEKPADSDADYGSEDEAEEMEAEEEEERDDSDADVERMNRMLADVAGQVREAERQGAVYDAELEQRMALEGRDELQGLFDSHAGLKGLVKERIKELEVVEIMLNFAENAVDGTSRNKRRRIN